MCRRWYSDPMETIYSFMQRDRIMAAPLVGYPGTQLTNSSVYENLNQPKIQSETLIALHNEFNFDALFPFMDLSIEAEALGLKVEFADNEPPTVVEHPVTTKKELKKLELPTSQKRKRMRVVDETISMVKERVKERALIGGYAASPFTLAGLLMGAENIAVNTLLEPDFCKEVALFATEVIIPYALSQEAAGADFIVLLDPSAVLLSPSLYEEFVQPYVEQVASALSIPTLLHVCGQTTPIMGSLAKTAVAGLSVDKDVDIPSIMPLIPPSKIIVGNIDPVSLFLNGEPSEVRESTEHLIERMSGYKNFILSSGCDLPPATPLENIRAFAQAAKTL